MFEIFGDLTIFAVIFSKMGVGKDSGKLLFKKLFSSGGFTITESETSLTFSSSGSGSGTVTVNPYEIAYGTGSGVTSSSLFKVCTTTHKESFYGFGSIRAEQAVPSENLSISDNSFIIGGSTNSILNTKYSNVISGFNNYINGGELLTIIGGSGSEISQCSNIILGGQSNRLSTYANNSVILGGKNNNLQHCRSLILSSAGSFMATGFLSGQSNGFNLISSSSEALIINRVNFLTDGGTLNTNNSIFSSNSSKIENFGTFSLNGEIATFSSPVTWFNNLISTKNSKISNSFALDGYTSHNNVLSSECVCSYGNHNNIIASKCVSIKASDTSSEKPTAGTYNQIISSYRSCSLANFSNIISSDESIDLSGPESRKGYSNIITSRLSKIYEDSTLSTILSSRSVCVKSNNSSIISSAASRIGSTYSLPAQDGLIISSYKSCIGAGDRPATYTGVIISSRCALNCIFSGCGVIMISSFCNTSFEQSTFIGGHCNVSGFGLNNSIYGAQYNKGVGQTMYDYGSWRGSSLTTQGSSHLIGGCKSKTTHSFNSVVLSTRISVLSNVRNTIIAGGLCNRIEAHGSFGTVSENWFVLGQNTMVPGYTAISPPLVNRPPYNGALYYGFGVVKNNFIIGGQCNSFGSCTDKNYCSSYSGVGLTTSKTHYVYNSGIVGGYRNKIYNKSKLLTEDWAFGYNPNNCIVNSVIIGGENIILEKSNTVAVQEMIVAQKDTDFGLIRPSKNGIEYSSITGFFATVTNIKVINGIVVGVNV
jgi:hypothetical protein